MAGQIHKLRLSATPYLATTLIFSALSAFGPYYVRTGPLFADQPLGILLGLVGSLVSFGLWLLYSRQRSPGRWQTLMVVGLLLTWGSHILIVILRGDSFNYLVWMLPLFALMLLLKPPTIREMNVALQMFALALGVLLGLGLLTQWLNLLEPLPKPEFLIEYQRRYYWLPLDGFFNIQGRWTGPLGHDTRTAFAAAMMTIISAATWSRLSRPLFILGLFFLLAASVRASYLATFTGVALVVLFGRSKFARIPTPLRWFFAFAPIAFAALVLSSMGSRFSGRDNIWPAFFEVWRENILFGASQVAIAQAEGLVSKSGDAHNIFVDEIARYGIVGFTLFMLFILGAAYVCGVSANRGYALPAAVLVGYLITTQTDQHGDWLHWSYHIVPVVTAVFAAAVKVDSSSHITTPSRLQG